MIPSLRRTLPDLPAPLDLPADQERRYLLNAFRDFTARSARMHALVLVLDDLQWADEPTLLLVEHLAEILPELPCLVIGTYRDVELDVGRPLARTLESLLRRHLAERISLRRLGQEGVHAMLVALSGQEPPDVLVKTVFSETEGNPFFVEEVFRHLAEEGRLFDEKGAFRADLRIEEVDVPEGVRLVIGRRLERLAEATREVLAAAAILGRIFGYRTLAAVAERADEDLLDALEEAERAHLVNAAGRGREERYEFAHELVRQTLLSGLASSRRRRLHLRAADAIESVYGEQAAEHAADLAHHLVTAGAAADATRTTRWLRVAAERALQAAAPADALRHAEEALALDAWSDPREHAELLFLAGSAQRGTGRWEDALATWMRVLDLLDEAGDVERSAEVAWHVGSQLLWAGRRDELADLLARALTRLEGTQSVPHARLLLGAAAGFTSAGALEPARFMVGKAEAMADSLDDAGLAADVAELRCFVDWTFPRLAEARAHGRRAAEQMRQNGALWDLASVESFLCSVEMLSGDEAAARQAGERATELADRLGHVGAHIYVNRALAPIDVQRTTAFDEYVALMRDEVVLARESGIAWAESNARWNEAIGELWRGNWDAAVALGRGGVPPDLPAAYAGWGHGVHALVMAQAGAPEDARALIDRLWGELPEPGGAASSGSWMFALFAVETLAVLGDWDRLAELRPVLDDVEATGLVRRVVDSRSVDALRGLMGAAIGDGDAVERSFQATVQHADERGFRIESAEVRRLWALALDRLGGREEQAAALRAAAGERYRDLGMSRHAELCEG
ncbi:MAG: hypothetical protein LC722_00980 [Actinobacteria bacterium]|nr:hypothetical protein [Actinomycetota bacterium]